ncbi:hypothetical protein BP6252_00908 [Coleophoma cylindrospora]|uniref:DNA polymerase epsilon subunit D n=1 Tax=Coleophoma cylindrospora TaxID=1849047 RepID=A0A3D8SRE1_9HELO|nr:hypothetical protein BP6252_00908 [Coleophoma cylindrospora]
MPPRKSDAAKATAAATTAATAVVTGDEGAGTPAKETKETKEAKEKEVRGDGVNIEDLNLPKSIVTRLAKGVLPPNTQIQGNAMLAMSKSATVFVNYLASADPSLEKRKEDGEETQKNIELIEMNYRANAHTQKAQRKTISPQDVFAALQDDLEFPDFVPRLEAELAKFNEISTEKRNTYRKKVAADKAADKSGAAGDAEEGGAEADEATEEMRRDANGQPAAKKARRESGHAEEVGDAHEKETEEPEADEEEEEEEDEEEEEESALAALDREVEEEELARADEMDGNDDDEDDSESD